MVTSPRHSCRRLIGSSSKVPVKASVMRYKRLLHTLHRDFPVRLTKRQKTGSIILISKARAIQRIQQYLTPASMKQALAGPDANKWRAARDAEHMSLEDEDQISGWADRAFISGEGERKNCYGYCFQLGRRRKSRMFINVCMRSTLIAQSSTEAELSELLLIRSFLVIGKRQVGCMSTYCYERNGGRYLYQRPTR